MNYQEFKNYTLYVLMHPPNLEEIRGLEDLIKWDRESKKKNDVLKFSDFEMPKTINCRCVSMRIKRPGGYDMEIRDWMNDQEYFEAVMAIVRASEKVNCLDDDEEIQTKYWFWFNRDDKHGPRYEDRNRSNYHYGN